MAGKTTFAQRGTGLLSLLEQAQQFLHIPVQAGLITGAYLVHYSIIKNNAV